MFAVTWHACKQRQISSFANPGTSHCILAISYQSARTTCLQLHIASSQDSDRFPDSASNTNQHITEMSCLATASSCQCMCSALCAGCQLSEERWLNKGAGVGDRVILRRHRVCIMDTGSKQHHKQVVLRSRCLSLHVIAETSDGGH